MILDPYIVRAVSAVTAKSLFEAYSALYPEYELQEDECEEEFAEWLAKLRKTPGRALSTGRRNSVRGELTCALLRVLGVMNPRAARPRLTLAWDIVNSPAGASAIGHVKELDDERAKRLKGLRHD